MQWTRPLQFARRLRDTAARVQAMRTCGGPGRPGVAVAITCHAAFRARKEFSDTTTTDLAPRQTCGRSQSGPSPPSIYFIAPGPPSRTHVRNASACAGSSLSVFFFFQAEDGIRDLTVTGVQTCALPI